MMKKLLTALLASTLIVIMAGCQKTQDSGDKKIDKSKELVVYTNSGSNGRDVWLTEQAAKAGFKIQVSALGASALTNRILAEKNNPVADVVFGLNNIEYEKLKKAEVLKKWKPKWVDGVDQTLINTDGFYYPVSTTPLVLMYNNTLKNPPSDWIDLVKEEYKKRYQIHNLSGGTGKTILASILSRYKDPKGELGVSSEGWKIAKEYLGNAYIIPDGEDFVGAVISNKIPMSMYWASGLITEQKARNYKFGIMAPKIGVPYVVESVAILKTTKHPETAEDFLNWLGSSEMQLAWSNKWGTIPAQKEALNKSSADIKELMNVVTPQSLDWEFIAKNIDAWVEKAELEYVK